MSKLFDQIAWAVYDCISGASVMMDKESYALGSGEGVDLDFGDDECVVRLGCDEFFEDNDVIRTTHERLG